DRGVLAAMVVHQFLGNGETKPGAAFARHTLKRLEEMSARLLGHAWASVGHVDDGDCTLAPCGDGDLAWAIPALKRLHGVAAEVAQHAKKLVAVGIDLELLVDLDLPVDEIRARQAKAVANL